MLASYFQNKYSKKEEEIKQSCYRFSLEPVKNENKQTKNS